MKTKLKELGISFLVLIVALILISIMTPLGLLYVVYRSVFYYRKSTPIRYSSYSMFSLAYAIDCVGNVICSPLLNKLFLKGDVSIWFGFIEHTVSLILELNRLKGNLSKFGYFIWSIIEYLDPGHFDKVVYNYFNPRVDTKRFFY
jgi:hypothetical protein